MPKHIELAAIERPLAIALALVAIEPGLVQAKFLGELLAYSGRPATIASEQVGHIVALAVSTIVELQVGYLFHFVVWPQFPHRSLLT